MENITLSQTKIENGINYTLVGDYYIPNLVLPTEEKDLSFGKYGRMRLDYLKRYHKIIYVNLLTSCKLEEHLHDINIRCNQMVEQIVKSLATQNGVDEKFKASIQIWHKRV